MAKINIKMDLKKIEKNLNKEMEKIVKKKQKELIVKSGMMRDNKMNLMSKKEEEMLFVILSKYDNNMNFEVSGEYEEFPQYMHFCIKDTMENLKLYGYISFYTCDITGCWNLYLTPDGISYFEKKGMSESLFIELSDNAKELLKKLVVQENAGQGIDVILREKIANDTTDKIVRGIIGTLRENGLLTVIWADNTVYYSELTNAGRTYFEREKKYMERLEKMNTPSFNIGTMNANNSNVVFGNATNSTFNINNSINHIEQLIEEKGDDDKQELSEILGEVKDYIENIEASKMITKNSGLFKRISNHLSNHGWFYAEIVGLLGQVCLKTMGVTN